MKNVVLIRHGQSLGQTAWDNGISRKDKSLLDCFLTERGIREATKLRSDPRLLGYNFDLVCTSPLTRAVATCVMAFGRITEHEIKESADGAPHTPFIAHSAISEAGTGIPENTGRAINTVKKDLKKKLLRCDPSAMTCLDHIDFSLLPESWPIIKKSVKKCKLESFLKWLLLEREEKTIAVVCHYNIIRWLLGNAINRVSNCMPIECVLFDDGTATRLILASHYESANFAIVPKDTKRKASKKNRWKP